MTPSHRIRLAGAATVVALALALAACGSGSDKASTKDTSATTSTTKAEVTTTTEADTTTSTTSADDGSTTTTLSSEGTDTETSELDTLPDGDHYGYMAGHEMGKVEGQDVEVIIWDEVELFTGAAAVKAAHEDGAIPADQDFVENDYYIRNNNQKVRRLAVVPDASVTTLKSEGSSESVPSSVSEVWKQPYLFKINVGNVRGITTVSSIDAVYLP